MKIRIKGNSLRLRLTQTEVEAFAKRGSVSDSISFGDKTLTYRIQTQDRKFTVAEFEGNTITVWVPGSEADKWAGSEQVGMQNEVQLKSGDTLSILIEKDFQCLKPRAGEDESDLYKNPLA